MSHQITGTSLLAGARYYAMGAEQGTGKTWMILADAEARFLTGDIDALLVIAPNGVHVNWIEREIPKHVSIPVKSTYWVSGPSKKHMTALTRLLSSNEGDERVLKVHAMNIDAVNTASGYAYAEKFIASFPPGRVMMVVDESHTVKSPDAKRTQKVIALGRKAGVRRIASGTIVANSPLDVFMQFEFLESGLLGTRSYRAFVSEYAELLPASSPLVADIVRKTGVRGAPQIVSRNSDGTLRFKNLDKLSALMAPHTFRVTKAECLDLPEKIYQTVFFELDSEQRAAYNHIKAKRNWVREDGDIDTFTALSVITKLRQVTSGFILVEGEPTTLAHAAPRLAALEEVLDGVTGSVIIWASFREELARIAALLRKRKETFVEYHGGTTGADRTEAINAFQEGRARIFLGNPAAAGTGLTLTAAETAIYYSSSFSLTERSQSEDRCHRIGTTKHVVYIDIVGHNTIDERIASALQNKKITAEIIMGGL
jgi:SNF2 family DNA or RNA helicase